MKDNGRKEEIQKYLEMKYNNDTEFKKMLENGGKKLKILIKKFSKFNKEIGPNKQTQVFGLLIYLIMSGPTFWKTIYEANGIEEDGFLYKDKYKKNSFIYIKEIVRGLHDIHDNVIKKHSIYKKY